MLGARHMRLNSEGCVFGCPGSGANGYTREMSEGVRVWDSTVKSRAEIFSSQVWTKKTTHLRVFSQPKYMPRSNEVAREAHNTTQFFDKVQSRLERKVIFREIQAQYVYVRLCACQCTGVSASLAGTIEQIHQEYGRTAA